MDLHGALNTDLLMDIPLHTSFPHLQTSLPSERELIFFWGGVFLSVKNTPGRKKLLCFLPELDDRRQVTLEKL